MKFFLCAEGFGVQACREGVAPAAVISKGTRVGEPTCCSPVLGLLQIYLQVRTRVPCLERSSLTVPSTRYIVIGDSTAFLSFFLCGAPGLLTSRLVLAVGTGKSCLLHRFTEDKCKREAGGTSVFHVAPLLSPQSRATRRTRLE